MQNELKERFKAFRDSLKDHDLWFRYQSDLKEEGVKALLIVPLFIECLGYNNLDDYIFENLNKRCNELIEKHPDKSNLFENYIKKQEEENDVLETKVVCSTMVIRRK